MLRRKINTERFPFRSTAEIAVQKQVIGQERAVRSMDFALHMQNHGFNVYVSGAPGTGKKTIVLSMIHEVSAGLPVPEDWCYVNNFRNPDRPQAISLPAGMGREFQRDIEHLVASLREDFPKAFQSKDYEDQHQALEEEFSSAHKKLGAELEEQAKAQDFLLKTTRVGFIMLPLYKGKTLDGEAFAELSPATQAEIKRKEKIVDEAIRTFRQKLRVVQETVNKKVDELNQRVARYTSEHLFERLMGKYQAYPKVLGFIQTLQQDVQENFEGFLTPHETSADSASNTARYITHYAVNLLVDNDGTRGAPVIEDSNPTYNNLVGRIEKVSRYGFLSTDFTLIKAGSILKANGGYLVVNVLDVLRNPFSWDALKRIIQRGEVVIEDIAELYGLVAAATLKPEPIPIRLRVVLLGNPLLYYLLQAYDEEFSQIFKVKADFDLESAHVDESPVQYANFVADLCSKEGLLHFDRDAVAALMEQAARLAGQQDKLTLQFSHLADIVREASFWAGRNSQTLVAGNHVHQAIEEKIYRSNLLEERIRELIVEGTLMIDVSGREIGQINAITVADLGDFMFGHPLRITARVFIGQDGIINIEREADMSGKTHNKGMLILSGYLGGRYARMAPLSLSATVTFEQSYGMVDGDSASVAELAALLSALSNTPLRQDLAVTGSVNQHGQVQAVGAVNEKIEGYFTICKSMGLNGRQGMIIPRSNCKHLMLKQEVVDAVAAGNFHVYAVDNVDNVLEILTGTTAGERFIDGTYPKGTINAAVQQRLLDMEARLLPKKRRQRRPAGRPARDTQHDEEQ
jgi:lon-related putative ATP-dependent protease